MIAMRPINEPEVINSINNGRFDAVLFGYVVMDGPNYLGHILYTINNETTVVLDASLNNNMLVDGAVRACVAAGEYKGAKNFIIKSDCKCLMEWRNVFCKTENSVPNEKLFTKCK